MDAWAIARYDLELTDEEWLEMTPRQLQALRSRHLHAQQREELLMGIVASTTANFSFCRPERPLTPEQFMLHPMPRPASSEPAVTGESLMSLVRALPKQFISSQVH